MHLPQIARAHSKDMGPLVRLTCSQCDAIRWFHLHQHCASIVVFGIALSRTALWSIQCSRCQYPIDISDADALKAQKLLVAARMCVDGSLSEEKYQEMVREANTELLRQHRQMTETWKCPRCGEASPSTLGECWKCSAPRLEQRPDGVETVPTPSLDRVLRSGRAGPLGPMGV